ncbi:glycosyltransferase [Lentisphaera marina]|uniref:glycosyltransferase n=1 Tax=Lentisphaera marina TaxID=1111041 RepID=UPI002365E7A1|nr:glycosyltransferase [Lentisphaera marina]MDD7986903.1 glycosyltransferase [Lentisphaera marina]
MVGLMFHRFGPYHLARLQAAIDSCNQKIIGLELSQSDSIYKWDKTQSELPIITIFEREDILKMPGKKIYKGIKNTIKKHQLSALAVQGWTPWGIAGILAARDLNIPIILMSESNQHDFKRHPLKEFLKKLSLKLCDTALVGGESHKKYLMSLGFPTKHIFKGYDAIDNKYFQDQSQQINYSIESTEIKLGLHKGFFLSSNRFIEKKNLFRLIDAYSKYRQKKSSPQNLVMLGDGELKNEILSYIQEKEIPYYTHKSSSMLNDSEGFIYLPGFMQYDELPLFYSLAKCFVHVSTTEQWGLVVNEAMASSLPIILSKTCGCSSELFDGNGYLIDPYSVDEIFQALQQIDDLSTKELMNFEKQSNSIIENWGPQKFGSSFNKALGAVQTSSSDRHIIIKYILKSYLQLIK